MKLNKYKALDSLVRCFCSLWFSITSWTFLKLKDGKVTRRKHHEKTRSLCVAQKLSRKHTASRWDSWHRLPSSRDPQGDQRFRWWVDVRCRHGLMSTGETHRGHKVWSYWTWNGDSVTQARAESLQTTNGSMAFVALAEGSDTSLLQWSSFWKPLAEPNQLKAIKDGKEVNRTKADYVISRPMLGTRYNTTFMLR